MASPRFCDDPQAHILKREMKNLMDVKQVAEYLRLTPLTIYRMVWKGKIPYFRLRRGRGRIRFRREAVDEVLFNNRGE